MELWDVYDKKGRKTGTLKEKEADYLPGEYHLACLLYTSRALLKRRGKL